MRVIAGTKRSMPLKAPVGMDTRPTQDRTKETLFNVLQNTIPGCHFLDLYSGSGAIAIEALSRGAQEAVLVENDRKAIDCIQANLTFTKCTDDAALMTCDVLAALRKLQGHKVFDVIFMDPPYALNQEEDVFSVLQNADYVDEYSIIVVEADLKKDFSFLNNYGFEITKVKTYKTNQHVFIRRSTSQIAL